MSDKKMSMCKMKDNTTMETTGDEWKKVAACFLGPKAENKELYLKLMNKSITDHMELREHYYKDEDPYIDETVKESEPYKKMCELLEIKRAELSNKMKNSVPFFSQRYQGHMLWDTLMAGSLGYMTAILYNQNNVATEASPVTSVLEKEVGEQLCELLGFEPKKSWGHITADGTIANIEAMWAARNLKAYAIAVRDMVCSSPKLIHVKENLTVSVFYNGKKERHPLCECTSWQLLNIDMEESLGLLDAIQEQCSFTAEQLSEMLKPFLLATKGIAGFMKNCPELAEMKVIVPATNHYSWPKSATLLGIGQDGIICIPVDEECKMDMAVLREKLEDCAKNHVPVLMVVAVMGSTAEGAVDNVTEIHRLKEEYLEKGLAFNLHCDAAWGGYLRSMLVPPVSDLSRRNASHYVPNLPLSQYAVEQYQNIELADTVTIDPHKAGFIPYAAGSLCYRNGQLRHMITFNAAYIHSDEETNMGIYGLEGSKPGAAAAAVWLAHATVPLNQSGYGQILGECCYTSKLYYCYWAMQQGGIDLSAKGFSDNYQFFVQPLIQIPSHIKSGDPSIAPFSSQAEVSEYIQKNIIGRETEEIMADPRAVILLQNVGSDVLMNTFVVNFSKNGVMNKDYRLMNRLNEKLFSVFSITQEEPKKQPKIILMMNTLSSAEYGRAFAHIVEEWGLDTKDVEKYNLNILVNTILQPWPNTKEFVEEVMKHFTEGVGDALVAILREENALK